MPSKKTAASKKRPKLTQHVSVHVVFVPILTLTFILWMLYRSLFAFPVWFDETIGKALFFGLPVWVYVTVTQFQDVVEAFAPYKLKNGLIMGVLMGGVFGFATSVLFLLDRGGAVMPVALYSSPLFWIEFFLSMCTAFWETLLFFALVQSVIMYQWKALPLWQQLVWVAGIFTLFHLANTLIRYPLELVLPQLSILFAFALGQALLFAKERNAYTLILSHSIWGMVLLTHTLV